MHEVPRVILQHELFLPVKLGVLLNPLVGCDCNAEVRPPGVSMDLLGHSSTQGQLQLLPGRNGSQESAKAEQGREPVALLHFLLMLFCKNADVMLVHCL